MPECQNSVEFPNLAPLLKPQSIAVIGASEQPGNLGGVAISLMQKFGYAGEILPVHPKQAAVHGLSSVANVSDLAEPADLAVIAVGAKLVEGIVRQCAAAGIRYGIVWAGGYSETDAAGLALQESLLETCRETGFTLVGPNCIGIINARSAMVASFASFLVESDVLIPGDIAMISQSGGLATMAQALVQLKGVGFGLTVSSGNEAMLTVADYIHAAAVDDEIKVIATYIEGIRDGDKFTAAVAVARAAGKPVIVLKGGRSTASVQAAAAHTGALAGESRVWEAIAKELGIISVTSLEELIDVSLYLSSTDLKCLPKGSGVAIVTFGGGSGVLSADLCADHGLEVPALQPETLARLAPLAPPIAAIRNPVDLTPQTFNQEQWFSHFPEVLEIIASDPGIHTIFCQFGPMAQRGAETAKVISALQARTPKAVLIAWPLAPGGVPDILKGEGVYCFEEYGRAIAAISKIAQVSEETAAKSEKTPQSISFDWLNHLPSLEDGAVISENQCHSILSQAGVRTAQGKLVRSAEEACLIAAEIGFPLAAKGISGTVTHRAAAGLLVLGIQNEDELVVAYNQLSVQAASNDVVLDGVYLQEMILGGMEVIVSGFRDPVFGPMISCGSGGNLTELMDDVVLARTPLDVASARQLLETLRIVAAAKKLISGAETEDLAKFIAHFSQVVHKAPWQRFVLEVNPVKWNESGVVAIDGLLIVDDADVGE